MTTPLPQLAFLTGTLLVAGVITVCARPRHLTLAQWLRVLLS